MQKEASLAKAIMIFIDYCRPTAHLQIVVLEPWAISFVVNLIAGNKSATTGDGPESAH